jgi:hypothetical protein
MITLGEQFIMMFLQTLVLVLAEVASLAKGRAVTTPPTESHSHCQPSCKQCTPQPIQCTGSTRGRVGDTRESAREEAASHKNVCSLLSRDKILGSIALTLKFRGFSVRQRDQQQQLKIILNEDTQLIF